MASGNDLPHCCWTRAAHSYCTKLACLTRPYHELACLTRPYHSTVESFGHDLTPLAVGVNSAVLFDILHTIYDTRYMIYVQNDIWNITCVLHHTITYVNLYLKTDYTYSLLRHERYKHLRTLRTNYIQCVVLHYILLCKFLVTSWIAWIRAAIQWQWQTVLVLSTEWSKCKDQDSAYIIACLTVSQEMTNSL